MDKIKQLEIKKIIKELDYLESDFEYKSEIVVEIDSGFMKSVGFFLENNPPLKEIFDDRIDERLDIAIKRNQDESISVEVIDEEIVDNKSQKLKKLYRDIVKITHPDRVDNKRFNDIYIKATGIYSRNDLVSIYSVCNELKIDFIVDEEDEKNIIERIGMLKARIEFVESTFTWKWHYSETEQERNRLIFSYIKSRLG